MSYEVSNLGDSGLTLCLNRYDEDGRVIQFCFSMRGGRVFVGRTKFRFFDEEIKGRMGRMKYKVSIL